MNDDLLTEDRLRSGLRGIAEWGRPEYVPPLPAAAPRVVALATTASRYARPVWWAVAAAIVMVTGAVAMVTRDGDATLPAAAGTWTPMADAPIPARGNPASVWTGTEVVVVGGQGADAKWRRDAAAYNPSTDTWRRLPDAPEDVPAGSTAVWNGRDVIVLVGGPMRPVVRAAASGRSEPPLALDMQSLTWRRLPDPNRGWTFTAVAVGPRVFVLMGAGSGVTVGEIVDDAWQEVVELDRGAIDESLAWSGYVHEGKLVFVGTDIFQVTGRVGFVLELPDGTEASIEKRSPEPRVTLISGWFGGRGKKVSGAQAALVGDYLLVSGRLTPEHGGSGPLFTGRYDLRLRQWTNQEAAPLEARPHDDRNFEDTPLTSVGDGAVLIGGTRTPRWSKGGFRVMYDGARNEWRQLPNATIDLERAGHVSVWTGDELVIWGGLLDPRGGNEGPDTPANDGARLAFAAA